MPTVSALRSALRAHADPTDAQALQRYFQAVPGGYAEGDRFRGVRVPAVRAVVRAYRNASLAVAVALLTSAWHEERLLALHLMVERYQRGNDAERQSVFDAYLANLSHIDNWDLVDSSAPYIVGAHLDPHDRRLLETLARSKNLWARRVAVLATFHHIRQGEFDTALHIATLVLHDPHHLLHKAVGWMLREVGKRNRALLVSFLDAHWRTMPRTTVRYAIEHFTPAARTRYMS